jgi:hypothetical protein
MHQAFNGVVGSASENMEWGLCDYKIAKVTWLLLGRMAQMLYDSAHPCGSRGAIEVPFEILGWD